MNENNYIARHQRYVDYRLQVLRTLTGEEHIIINDYININNIKSIYDYLLVGTPHGWEKGGEATAALEDLRRLLEEWSVLEDGDILGYIYQSLRSATQKKKEGQFFTPAGIVNHLVDKSITDEGVTDAFTVLDPACGSGQFLIFAFRKLLEILMERGLNRDEAGRKIITKHLFGNDMDPMAAAIARYNLHKISGLPIEAINIRTGDFLMRNDLRLGSDISWPEKFSLIIGNPPWGSRLAKEKKQYYRRNYLCGRSGLNSFTLFMERSLDILRPRGLIAFLIPEAFLNIRAHRSSRLQVLERAKVLDIAPWGERFKGCFAPSVSLVLQEEPDAAERARHIVHISPSGDAAAGTVTLVPQASFTRTPENIFNINYSRRAVSLIIRIEEQGCFFLKGRARFFLGVVTGDNPGFISETRSSRHPDPILLGQDISPYRIAFSGHYFRFDPERLQQVAPRECYRMKNKLLYRFIGRRLTFALDREGCFSLNNVNGIIPSGVAMEPECLLALLNSRVMQYYYEKSFFTVKVLRGNLERLPLKILKPESRGRIKKLAGALIESENPGDAVNTREKIEEIIFREYGIGEKHAFAMSGKHDSHRGAFLHPSGINPEPSEISETCQ